MKTGIVLAALAGSTLMASAANASIAFSFADPVPGTQFTNVINGAGGGQGLLTWDSNAIIEFLVDGSTSGLGATMFSNARMNAQFTLGLGFINGGTIVIPVTGTFSIVDASNGNAVILTGTGTGSLVSAGTNSMLFSTDLGFAYTAGAALLAWLPGGSSIAPPDEAVFTITGLETLGGGPLLLDGGVVNSFVANSSFSGNTALVPTPGAMALLGLGGLAAARRRR